MKLLDRVLGNSNDYNLEYLNELLARIAPKEKEIIVKQKKNYGWAIALGAVAVTAAAGYACYKLFIEKKDKYDDFEDFDDFEDDFDFDDDELEAYLAEKREEAGEKVEGIKDTVKTKAEEVKDAAKTKTEEVKDTVKTKTEEVKDAVKEKAEEVKDKAEAVADKVKEAAQELKK
ncbi:hypothetical protein C3V36_00665 [Lachnospiraceae bacterium oral taxon 500]|nr:hypothetical protein C3V36_00665 [Lachnospiraceae bacterium oral taxon 500]